VIGVADIGTRDRLVAAFSKAAAEQGYSQVDVATVSRYAGLSADDFFEQFKGTEQALLAAQEAFIQRLTLEVEAACEEAGDWPSRVRATIAALVTSLGESSALARVFAIEAPGASLAAAELQFAALDRLAALLAEGRALYPPAAGMPPVTERALVGGAFSIVSEHLLAEDPGGIHVLEIELVQMILTPYLGAAAARRVAAAG
jgi:AcrR family transcriptional regulator